MSEFKWTSDLFERETCDRCGDPIGERVRIDAESDYGVHAVWCGPCYLEDEGPEDSEIDAYDALSLAFSMTVGLMASLSPWVAVYLLT
jgi:hypothetical protein